MFCILTIVRIRFWEPTLETRDSTSWSREAWGDHREMGDCNFLAVLIPFQSQGQDV